MGGGNLVRQCDRDARLSAHMKFVTRTSNTSVALRRVGWVIHVVTRVVRFLLHVLGLNGVLPNRLSHPHL